MSEREQPSEQPTGAPRIEIVRVPIPEPRIPLTIAIIVLCVAITGLLNWPEMAARTESIVAPNTAFVWKKHHVWALVTSAFAHKEIWHLVFNMWWSRDFGRLLEPRLGRAKYLAFIVGAAVVSSGWQLLVSLQTGIGYSGVVYAFCGYILARRASTPEFAAFMSRRTMGWLLGWLVLCIGLTAFGIWRVGNAAHVGGLAFGFFVGTAAEKARLRIPSIAILGVLGAGAVVACTYMPWAETWRNRDGLLAVHEINARAKAGDAEAQAQIGGMLVRDAKRRKEGLELLEKSAKGGSATGMNALAWTRATCKDPSVRNGAEAVRLAEMAVASAPKEASYVDTLAVAYAEMGRWDEALATQKRALAMPGAEVFKDDLDAHLASIEKREPIRD